MNATYEEIQRYFKCIRKITYPRLSLARREASRLQKIVIGKKMNAYKCKYCGYWHVGGKKKSKPS